MRAKMNISALTINQPKYLYNKDISSLFICHSMAYDTNKSSITSKDCHEIPLSNFD